MMTCRSALWLRRYRPAGEVEVLYGRGALSSKARASVFSESRRKTVSALEAGAAARGVVEGPSYDK